LMEGHHLLLALGWTVWCALHSLLASIPAELAIRARMGLFAPRYRLGYNVFAAVSVAPLVIMEKRWAAGILIDLGWGETVRAMVFYAALLAMAWVIYRYGPSNISGLAPADGPDVPPKPGELNLTGPFTHVRHPLYALAFLILWSRPMTDTALVSTIALSVYIFIGARLEERRMIVRFGAEYARYRATVPAFIPWPRRGGGNGG